VLTYNSSRIKGDEILTPFKAKWKSKLIPMQNNHLKIKTILSVG
jgi:hypothetical protein